MMRYSIQARDRTFVNGFLSFAKNMGKNIGKNKSKNLSCTYSQNLLDHAKKSPTDAFKTASWRAIQKTAEATGGLICNKIADTVTKPYDGKAMEVSKNSQQNNSETVINDNDKEIPKESYKSPETRQKIINDVKLI